LKTAAEAISIVAKSAAAFANIRLGLERTASFPPWKLDFHLVARLPGTYCAMHSLNIMMIDDLAGVTLATVAAAN
jgi:hypothetical protein